MFLAYSNIAKCADGLNVMYSDVILDLRKTFWESWNRHKKNYFLFVAS